jgi:hypothetical protein
MARQTLPGKLLARRFLALLIFTLKMEVILSSETSVHIRIIWLYFKTSVFPQH